MNQETIDKYYKILSIANFVASTLFALTAYDLDWSERITIVLQYNLGYHLFYWFLSKVPSIQLNKLKQKKSPLAFNIAPLLFNLFSVIIIAFSIFIFGGIIVSIGKQGNFQLVLGVFIPAALFLGAIAMRNSISNFKQLD